MWTLASSAGIVVFAKTDPTNLLTAMAAYAAVLVALIVTGAAAVGQHWAHLDVFILAVFYFSECFKVQPATVLPCCFWFGDANNRLRLDLCSSLARNYWWKIFYLSANLFCCFRHGTMDVIFSSRFTDRTQRMKLSLVSALNRWRSLECSAIISFAAVALLLSRGPTLLDSLINRPSLLRLVARQPPPLFYSFRP